MGIYVYSMRKPVKHVEFRGEGYEIARLQFLLKCSMVSESKLAKMQTATCESRFPTVPRFVVLGKKWENGMDVYCWMGKKPWAYDTPNLPYYKIGVLNLPVLRVEPDYVVTMPFKYVPAGGRFSMSENFLKRFNAEVIDQKFIADEYKKCVTNYTASDVFEMDEFGEFSIAKGMKMYRYRVNHLPNYYSEWTVHVEMDGNWDRTNEFEAMHS